MAKSTHKGSELNNVQETWEQNERERAAGKDLTPVSDTSTGDSELEKVIHEEAREYDNEKKEDRLLGGERATVNDDGISGS